MGISLKSQLPRIEAELQRRAERTKAVIARKLCEVGEKVVNEARTSHTYLDQTGNLSSSLGYAVSVDGVLAGRISTFEVVKNGDDGSRTGKDYLLDVIRQFPKGVALVVVAGMDYASHVEDNGYNVTQSAERLADNLLSQLLKKKQ